ncbi:MAG: hypothetical protein ACPF8V_04200, partial [Luteibaculum sp.]
MRFLVPVLFLLLVPNLLFSQAADSVWSCTVRDHSRSMVVNSALPLNNGKVVESRALLGNKLQEDALIFFAKSNRINYVVLRGLDFIFSPGTDSVLAASYQTHLSAFVQRARQDSIGVGLAFGQELSGLGSPFKSKDASTVASFKVLQKEFPEFFQNNAQNQLKHPENFPHLYDAFYNLAKLGKWAGDGIFKDGALGLEGVLLHYSWWDDSVTSADAKYDTVFIPLLQLLADLKTNSKVGRVEVRQGLFPTDSVNGPAPSEISNYYYKWAAGILPLIDRLYMEQPIDSLEELARGARFKQLVQIIKGEAEASSFATELFPVLSAGSSIMVDESKGELYSGVLGDLLNRGDSLARSIPQIEHLYQEFYEDTISGIRSGNFLKLAGYHWDNYQVMPHAVYNSNPDYGKYVGQRDLLWDNLVRYDLFGQSILLEVHNTLRPLGADTTSKETSGLDYTWSVAESFSGGRATVFRNDTNPYFNTLENVNGFYWVSTNDAMGCKAVSVPVLIQHSNDFLFMKDYDSASDTGQEPNNSGELWNSPDLWVSPDNRGQQPVEAYALADSTNYIYVRVRNKSTESKTLGQEKLMVYFALGSASLSWPNKWINSTNSDSLGANRI